MKVYYCQPDHMPQGKLVKSSEFFDKTYPFQRCPAWSHKENRIFVGLSPIDLNFDKSTLTDLIDFRKVDDLGPKPVYQLKFPMFFFWTYDPDVWVHQYDHPLTALNNNFVTIGAWWNLSRWVRNTNTAVVPVDTESLITIKEGDPLFRVSFYSKDLGDDIILEEVKEDDIPEDILDKRDEQFDIIKNNPEDLPKKIFKCPFARIIY